MTVIAECLSRIELGEPTRFENLVLYPLFGDGPAVPDYRLLDAVLADQTARVTELSEGGSVPELSFVNAGDRPVLLLDGEELLGAQQNRILNLTVLAPASRTIVIPVSCVEAGRWHAVSSEFRSARRAHFATGRASKSAQVSESLRRRGSRASQQSAVWDEIRSKSARMKVTSRTGAAAALYDSQRERLDAFRAAFSAQPHQRGALFALNGRLFGLDLFDSPATLAALLGKLVESYALDAIDLADQPSAETLEAPGPWIEAIAQAKTATFPAIGEGEDWRLQGADIAGGALVRDGSLIHLCVFRTATDDPGQRAADARPELREARATQRRVGRGRLDSGS